MYVRVALIRTETDANEISREYKFLRNKRKALLNDWRFAIHKVASYRRDFFESLI